MRWPVILKMLLPLILGVIVHFYSGFSVTPVYLVALLVFLVVLNLPFNRKSGFSYLFVVLMTGFFFFLGGYLSEINKSDNHEDYFIKNETYNKSNFLVKVIEPPEEKSQSVKCIVIVIQREQHQTMGKSLVYFGKDSSSLNISYGDIIAINTNFNSIRSNGNPKEFDYARYLKIHNIHHQAYVKSNQWKLISNKANPVLRTVYDWRDYLSSILDESGMSAKNKMVANALLLGQKQSLDKDVLRSYSSAGAMHVLAVSGLHVGIIMLILNFLLKPLKRIKYGKKLFVMSVLLGIWIYALITGLSPSVLRASVMFTFIVIGSELQRDTTIYQSILTSAFILMIIDPYIIFQVGFQLSYLAVLGIVYLQPKIENLIYVKNKILYRAWQITAVSIAAQIATFPLGLYYFHQFPNFFMISNLIVIPLAFFILIVGISFLVLNQIPIISEFLIYILDTALTILNKGVNWIEQLPYSILWGISIEWYEVFILYTTILISAVAFINRKKKALFGALVGTFLLVGYNIYEKINLESHNQMVIYNVSHEVAVDFFYGRKNAFYSTPNLINDEDKMLFHVKHNWFYRTGQEEPYHWGNINQDNLFKVDNKTVWVTDSTTIKKCNGKIPNTDFVVLYNMDFLRLEVIDKMEMNKTKCILASNLDYQLKKFIYYRLDSSAVFDLSKEGAYIYEF